MRKFTLAVVFVLLLSLFAPSVFGAANPNVVIVNPVPGVMIYSDNLLISVKVTEPTTIKVKVNLETTNGDTPVITAIGAEETFTSTTNLSFYTRKIEIVKPGNYRVVVDTIDAGGSVIFTNSSLIEIRAKEDNPAENTATGSQSGPAQFLKNLLKIIFN